MRPLAYLALVAAGHIAFLFGSYGTGFFSLTRFLPYAVVLAIWLGLSSVLAGCGYFKIAAGLFDSAWARLLLSATTVAISLYAGVFFAFNMFGT
jgi:hypothetical protein